MSADKCAQIVCVSDSHGEQAHRESQRRTVHQQCPNCTPVIRTGNSPVTLLTGRIPDLGLDSLSIHLDASSRELDADRRLGLEGELVARETGKDVGLPNARVSNQDHLEQIVIATVEGRTDREHGRSSSSVHRGNKRAVCLDLLNARIS